MAIRRVRIPQITTTGVDGSATGEGQTVAPVVGRVLAVHLNYSAGQAATTDVTLATLEAPVQTVLVKSNTATDAWYFPRVALHDAADAAAVTYDGTNEIYESQPVCDVIKATIAQADGSETVDITILYEE